jgi:hypothetical protein
MPKASSAKAADLSLASVPAFCLRAMAAALWVPGAQLAAKKLKIVEEDIKIHGHAAGPPQVSGRSVAPASYAAEAVCGPRTRRRHWKQIGSDDVAGAYHSKFSIREFGMRAHKKFPGCQTVGCALVNAVMVATLFWPLSMVAAPIEGTPEYWRARFEAEVDRRLDVPGDEQQRYVDLLNDSLVAAGQTIDVPQAFVLVDRSVHVQAAFVLLRTPEHEWLWLGASPVSTGRIGSFDHFRTPLGVFPHSLDNPDFRAEGTFNENHIRGYGLRGMRVFDFGWIDAERGWGSGGTSAMRLQMHATDPATLEPRLGRAESKGCIRIPASLNVFIDRYGLLDRDYIAARTNGKKWSVMRADSSPIPWPGHYLVVIDSNRTERPSWSPLPGASQSELAEVSSSSTHAC